MWRTKRLYKERFVNGCLRPIAVIERLQDQWRFISNEVAVLAKWNKADQLLVCRGSPMEINAANKTKVEDTHRQASKP